MRIVHAESKVGATRAGFIFFLLFFSMGLIHGCRPITEVKERSKKAVSDLSFSKAALKKTVGLSLFRNRTFITGNTVEMMFQKHLLESVRKRCPGLIIITPGHGRSPEFLTAPPKTKSGEIDNFALAEAAKRSGLNAVVTGELISFSGVQKDKGLLWYKEDRHFADLVVGVTIYDTLTAAKLLDESLIHEFEVDESEYGTINAKKMDDVSYFENEILKAAESLGSMICGALDTLPWNGSVVSVSGAGIVISGGSRVGIKIGDVFEVYAKGKQIRGGGGDQYFLPGVQVGKIKIKAVSSDRAEAVAISDGGIEPGSSIQQKR